MFLRESYQPMLTLGRLCHLLISVDNESMALEEFIIDLCEESVNSALLVGGHGSEALHCGFIIANTLFQDFLALPNLPSRPVRRSNLELVQDLYENL
jgi:hypothetical protein